MLTLSGGLLICAFRVGNDDESGISHHPQKTNWLVKQIYSDEDCLTAYLSTSEVSLPRGSKYKYHGSRHSAFSQHVSLLSTQVDTVLWSCTYSFSHS